MFIHLSFQIVYDINQRFMEELKRKIGQDYSRIERMSIVEEGIVKVKKMEWDHTDLCDILKFPKDSPSCLENWISDIACLRGNLQVSRRLSACI